MSSSTSDSCTAFSSGHGSLETRGTSRPVSKIPVPTLHRANSTGSSRSAPSSGTTTPVLVSEPRVVYRKARGSTNQARLDVSAANNRYSLNEQAFRSLPSSAVTSPASKKKSLPCSSSSSTYLVNGDQRPTTKGSSSTKKANGGLRLTKTTSDSTPEEVRRTRAMQPNIPDVFSRLSKPASNDKGSVQEKKRFSKAFTGAATGILKSRSQTNSRSGSVSPMFEANSYTTGARRSTMPSKPTSSKQVAKETNALAKLASKITAWAQKTQNEPLPSAKPTTKPQHHQAQEIPVRKTPSPYDRKTSALPVRRSSFKLKGSGGSISSVSSLPESESTPGSASTGVHDMSNSQPSDREPDSPFSDPPTPLVPNQNLSSSASYDRSSPESPLVTNSSSSTVSQATTPVTVIRKPPGKRSPYFRMATTASGSQRASAEIGELIGELNLDDVVGPVAMDADEYRRMAQDVKALKTVLLKLKRELQVDSDGINPLSPSGAASKGKTVRTRRPSPSAPDLSGKVDQLTQEKQQLNTKLESARKDLTARDAKITELEAMLKAQQEEAKRVKDTLSSLEKHREYLLDKVERLHADKHKLEDKISVMEKSQSSYERTLSDLEISDDEDDRTVRHSRNASSIVDMSDGCIEENSDPESQAVMSNRV